MDKFMDWVTHDLLIIIAILFTIMVGLAAVVYTGEVMFTVRSEIEQEGK